MNSIFGMFMESIMNTSGLLQSKLCKRPKVSMNIPKIEFIAYTYILL